MNQTDTDILRLVKLGAITAENIKSVIVKADVIAELRAEVVSVAITTAQYKTYTGTDYSA